MGLYTVVIMHDSGLLQIVQTMGESVEMVVNKYKEKNEGLILAVFDGFITPIWSIPRLPSSF